MADLPKDPAVRKVIQIVVAQLDSSPLWFLDCYLNGGDPISHERTNRGYSSPADCITSARHLAIELQKKGEL